MMDVTSGEMYFRIKNAAGFSSELATFNAFLRTDIDANHQKSEMFAQLKNIRSSRMHMRKDMVSKMMIANHIRHMIDTKRRHLLSKVEDEIMEFKDKADELKNDHDNALMKIVLQYSALLVSELELSRVNMRADEWAIKALQQQAQVAFQLRLFKEYVAIETRGLITLEILSKDNEQYKRCKKAIKDNITPSFLRAGNFQGVRVLNIYHLQNDRLAKYLKEAVKSNESGKVRGLFCALPGQSVFSMAVYGLHPKDSFSSPTRGGEDPAPVPQNLSPSKGRPVRDKTLHPSQTTLDRNLFEWSWFCYPSLDSTSRKASSDVPLVKGVGFAMKLSTHSSPSLATSSNSFLRFTRSSTPNDIMNSAIGGVAHLGRLEDSSMSEEGCHIALCRVLLSKVMNVSGKKVPDTSQFLEATRLGYDAIYLEDSEEYILLQPGNVLPEFIMHIQLVRNAEASEGHARKLQQHLLASSASVVGPSELLPVGAGIARPEEWLGYVDSLLTGRQPVSKGADGDHTLDDMAMMDTKSYVQRKHTLVQSVQQTTQTVSMNIKNILLESCSRLKR